MSDDILSRIDEVVARNARRFDPLGGEAWDLDRVERVDDGMRVRYAAEPAEEASPVRWVQSDTSPRVSFADVAAGPSAGTTGTVDVRRRVQDGGAPVPDRIGDVLRAEALRQGLTECAVDGVPWQYCGGRWSVSDGPGRTECGMAWPDCRTCRTPDLDAALASAARRPWWKRWLP